MSAFKNLTHFSNHVFLTFGCDIPVVLVKSQNYTTDA